MITGIMTALESATDNPFLQHSHAKTPSITIAPINVLPHTSSHIVSIISVYPTILNHLHFVNLMPNKLNIPVSNGANAKYAMTNMGTPISN